MSDSVTREQVHHMCLKVALDALSKPPNPKSAKQFLWYARCLRLHKRIALQPQVELRQTYNRTLNNMLLTAKLLATSNLETVTCVKKSLAPVDKTLFPNAKDSGNAV